MFKTDWNVYYKQFSSGMSRPFACIFFRRDLDKAARRALSAVLPHARGSACDTIQNITQLFYFKRKYLFQKRFEKGTAFDFRIRGDLEKSASPCQRSLAEKERLLHSCNDTIDILINKKILQGEYFSPINHSMATLIGNHVKKNINKIVYLDTTTF